MRMLYWAENIFFLVKLVSCWSSFPRGLSLWSGGVSWSTGDTMGSAQGQADRSKSIELQREPNPHSTQHPARCQIGCESSVSLQKNKDNGFPRKQFSFDTCHEVVSALESRHTCGPLSCTCRAMCPPPQSAESIHQAEVDMQRWFNADEQKH